MEEKKRGKKGDREVENRRKDGARCSARERAIKSSFIHTVSSVIVNVYIQYLRELLLSSKTMERIHN